MKGAFLPGNSTVELQEVAVPVPGHGEVLLRMKASTICGSDIRCIYHEHLGKGPEGYQGVVAGHDPSGQIVQAGPGCRRFGVGDRVIVYHISGCGLCNDCRRGYMISCTSAQYRRAYGSKDTRNWCHGKTGTAHVPVIMFRTPRWDDRAVCKWRPLYARNLEVTWCCYHRAECEHCGKVLRDSSDLEDAGDCPDY